jgi:hypothetical protein
LKAELEPIKGGAARTWKNFYDLFWVVATLRYVTQKQLAAGFPDEVWRKKCGTPKVIKALAEKGFLLVNQSGAITAKAKAVDCLSRFAEPEYPGKYNTQIIKLAGGSGDRDGIYNAEVLIKALKHPLFYALFYPDFYERESDQQPFLIPDAALVLKKEDKAKLVFLEIESQKSAWERYLSEKRRKYEAIAKDYRTFDEWWRTWCGRLGFKLCPVEEFGFEVWCLGKFRADWQGWQFKEEL